MSDSDFELWTESRLSGAYGSAGEEDEFRAVEADRRLRVWARDNLPPPAQATLPRLGPESPIESLLLEAFLASGFFDKLRVPSDVVVASGPLGLLLQQVSVPSLEARYRLDFAIMNAAEGVFLAIEADGHQWHEATPEQAQNDRKRDRRLIASGWTVVRFTGREVYRDAAACVREVLALVSRRRSEAVG